MENITESELFIRAGLVFGWLFLIFWAERRWPYASRKRIQAVRSVGKALWEQILTPRIRRNLGLWLCNTLLSPLIVLPLTYWATALPWSWREGVFGGAGGLIFDLVFLDFLIYWWHRLNHELPFLWRFHEIHHLDNHLDSTSALRFHFGEVLLSALMRVGFIVLLDIPLFSVFVFEILLLFGTIFHHSNLQIPATFERILSSIVVTPSIHWVHHHALRSDTDSNYSTVLSIWDRVFNSRSAQPRFPDMPIGVEGANDKNLPALLIRPFRMKEKADK
ncbi:sterol desaturase family protein [Kiloniella laminariae]|uniref:Sterol desaturase family protein n=1 Tax=Kiloniella laminariae TaxID=454162 RepID=A0ABT4LJ58_9PROT|nr:sterol desaturase family protein [Kiloniella laminariae]MCZ4281140.1 sterol desaturase family protein [Kiloniella laminariae]